MGNLGKGWVKIIAPIVGAGLGAFLWGFRDNIQDIITWINEQQIIEIDLESILENILDSIDTTQNLISQNPFDVAFEFIYEMLSLQMSNIKDVIAKEFQIIANDTPQEIITGNLINEEFQSLIALLCDKKCNVVDIHSFLECSHYLDRAHSTHQAQEISSIANAIPIHITAQLFNHKNKPLSNMEIYVYSPNFYAFVDRAKSNENGFIEFHNACVSSKMTNSDLYFVLNRYGLDEEQKDYHIKISPSKTIQPKDKRARDLTNQTMFFVKNIPKAIAFNDSIMPSIKVSAIEYIPSSTDSQTNLETITLKAHYSLKDSHKQYIQGDKQSYLTQSIQRHKHKTKWGYIVFDKDENIEEALNDLNKTKPLIKSARFKELEGITGEIISIPFEKEWEYKQVRFFAYLWRVDKDVGVDVEKEYITTLSK